MEIVLPKYPRELNSYSKFMSVDLKEANKMHYRIKGHLIPAEWPDSDIIKMYDSYFARCWNNNEIVEYSDCKFEKVWREKQLKDNEDEETEIDKVCIRGYD